MARTNIVLDDRLVQKAMRLTGCKSKRQLVDTALRELVRYREAAVTLRSLRGQVEWEGDLDAWRRSRR
jgi:Arc/MetJ family transcription regulator